MTYLKLIKRSVILALTVTFIPLVVWGAENLPHPDTYLPGLNDLNKLKKVTDDPTDLMTTYPMKDVLPPEICGVMAFDDKEAKRQTEGILGFKSPDLVGKISPGIKPGKYTVEDLEKYPGIKELFPPELLLHIKPGGPPLVGSMPEFEIIPTRQLYWYSKLGEATRQNLGKTKLDKNGYIVPLTWQGGFPFPQPYGKFKAQQLYYNFETRVTHFDGCYFTRNETVSFDRNLTRDKYRLTAGTHIKFMGRTLFPPYGWLDEHAKKNGMFMSYSSVSLEPRDSRGTVLLNHKYDDPNKMNQWMIFVPSLRRIRKMNSTDTQEPMGDLIYDDIAHISQKITPHKYPYKFEIIAEREYLMPIQYNRAVAWIDSKNGYALGGIQFMRRPCYVLQMTQLDPYYVYGKRIIYIDKETFGSFLSANYDHEGRLYRSQIFTRTFMADAGQISTYGTFSLLIDHADSHSTFSMSIFVPAPFERKDFTIQHLSKRGK